MVCNNCGAEIPDSSRYCSSCGRPVSRTEYGDTVGFNRINFKMNARKVLSKTYWYAFLICLINTIIFSGLRFGYRYKSNIPSSSGVRSSITSSLAAQPANLRKISSLAVSRISPAIWAALGIIVLSAVFIGLAFGIAYSLFLASPVGVGKTKFFIDNRYGKCELGNIIYAFRGGHYMNIVKSLAWRLLFQFLWTLLFLIPGIVKYYSYFLVPYILADNPDIGYDRALKLSMDMTRGYKFKIFVLQLSFIGWYLLGAICLAVGVLFVNPYYEASFAEMYVTLRYNALVSGLCSPQELNLFNEQR